MMPQQTSKPIRLPLARSPFISSAATSGARLGFVVLILAACGGSSDPVERGGAVPLTLENIYRDVRGGVFSAAISPDGRWVAAVAESADGRGIHLLDLTEEPPVPRFWLRGSSPVWSPDSRGIAFLRDGNLSLAPVGDPDAVPLTDGLRGVRAPAWSPDGTTVAVMASASGSQNVWLIPAAGGEPRQLTSGAMTADEVRFGVSWSPDGETVAYVANKADYWSDDVWLADVATGTERQLTTSLRAISTAPVWSPNGSRLAVLGVKKEQYWYLDIADLYLLDPAGGPEEPVPMSSFTTAYRYRPFWSGDGSRLFFAHQERGEHHLWSAGADGGAATRVTNLGGVFSSLSASSGAERLALVRSSSTEGAELYTISAAGGPAVRRTSLSPVWEGVRAPREVAYRSFDGHYIQGFLYLPEAVEEGAVCPALVQVHGGGTNSYLAGPNLTEQYLASQGFVVLAVNYRGGSGFGREFQDLGDEDWLNEQALDPGAAADWLRARPYVSGRVGIYGYSYGGMQSMAAITRTPDKFDAAAPMAGIYSERQTFEHQDRLGRVFTVDGHGGLPEERPEIYDKTETLARIGNITAPVLIQHGDRDVRAPFLNFELAVAAFEGTRHRVRGAHLSRGPRIPRPRQPDRALPPGGGVLLPPPRRLPLSGEPWGSGAGPGVDGPGAGVFEVAGVPGDDREVAPDGGGGEESVGQLRIERFSTPALVLHDVGTGPGVLKRPVHDAILEEAFAEPVELFGEFGAPPAGGHLPEAVQDLPCGDGSDAEPIRADLIEERQDGGVRHWPHQLRDDVRVDQAVGPQGQLSSSAGNSSSGNSSGR